jgi:hypothetical protein
LEGVVLGGLKLIKQAGAPDPASGLTIDIPDAWLSSGNKRTAAAVFLSWPARAEQARSGVTRMMTIFLTWLSRAVAAVTLAVDQFVVTPPATADRCGSHGELTHYIAKHYFEQRRGVGLTGDGKLFEVFISEQGRWTVLVSLPTGVSCVVLEGTDWQGRSLVAGPEA